MTTILQATPVFSPRTIRMFRSWNWVRSDFAEEFRRLSDAGAFRPDGTSETIWHTRTKFVLRAKTSLGFDVAYKSFFQIKSPFRYLLRRSPCASEAANYARLTEFGLPLPDLLAAGEIRRGFLLKNAFMVSRFVEGFRNGLDFFQEGIYAGNEPMLKQFCRGHLVQLAKLHDRGYVHGGFTPANLLYRRNPDGGMEFRWVDVAECAPSPLTAQIIADDIIRLFRYLKISAKVRRELEAAYLEAAKVPRTTAEELDAVLESRIVSRLKPWAFIEE
jgi:tRNA A-37 threonylcarbamoyl transferase component Bud32